MARAVTEYEPAWPMRTALAAYFRDNGFGPNGGYDEAWVDFKLGPIPFPFPNGAPRVRAVKYHDLHHVLTGYATDLRGELLISAWEIAAGCRTFVAAWHLNLGGLAMGALLWPRDTFRAFVRGRRSRSFYGLPYEALLDRTVGESRADMGIDGADHAAATASDRALFVVAAMVGSFVGAASFLAFSPLVPIGLAVAAIRRARRSAVA